MKTDWKMVRLGEVLHRADRFEKKDALTTYAFSGTYSYARGIFKSYEKAGSQFGLDQIQRIKTDDFVYCKIMAWEGAFGLVPPECDATVMSGAFVAYEVDRAKLEPGFLEYFFKLEANWRAVGRQSTGTNVRRQSLAPDSFENAEIPLPPLAEQQRLVAKLRQVQAQLAQVQALRQHQDAEVGALRNALFRELMQTSSKVPLAEVLRPAREAIALDPEADYRQITVRMEHRGVTLRGVVKGSAIGSAQFIAREGDFIISKIDARNGAMGLVPASLDGAVVTNDFPLFRCIPKVNLRFFDHFSNTAYFDEACRNASEGTTNRKRLKTARFEQIPMPLPPRAEQDRVVALLDGLTALRTAHAATAEQLGQLLPSLLDGVFGGAVGT